MNRFFYYIRYFFYIARNWNLRLATFSIFHEVRGEIKYGLNTSELNELQNLTLSGTNLEHAEIYQGSSYYLLENVFLQLKRLQASGGFVDLGCGRGRVLVVAAHFGFNKITGVDFARELCMDAKMNCKKISQKYPLVSWKIIFANAEDFKVEKNIRVIFFFNPFKEIVMRFVIENILQSLEESTRKIFIVYINPQYKHLFIQAGFTEVYYIRKMQFVEASILEK